MTSFDGINVLLLEDEFLIAMDAEEILTGLGVASVQIAANVADALALAESGSFDVAVLDVNINGEMSFSVARKLREKGVPVVFASGYELQSRPLPPEVGDNITSLAKPYSADRLKEAVASALAQRQPNAS